MDRESLVRDWLTNLESGCRDDATNPAFTAMAFVEPASDPEEAWSLILEGIRRASSEQVLGLIGAGALENFLEHHGSVFIARVEREAANQRFRTALSHVWRSNISDTVWRRIEKLQVGSTE
jgi:hypothetical protein